MLRILLLAGLASCAPRGTRIAEKIGCKNLNGKDVDWFVAIKLPAESDESKGYSFVYYDPTQTEWRKSPELLNSTTSAIGATINQIYKADQNKFYIAYNDDAPNKKVESGRAHSKGVALFDEKIGFWMLHSVPNYPPIDKYYYPESGSKFAQSFLCLSLDANALYDIGEYMRFAQVTPFMSNLPEFHKTVAPNLEDVVRKKSLTRKDTVFTTIRTIRTLGGQKLKAFSKHKKSYFDIWHDFIAKHLKTPMAVETWRNGAAKDVGTRCNSEPHVYDVDKVKILGQPFSSSKDHSKWGVSMNSEVPTVCIGDVNRQESQFKRGGGAVCIADSKLWKVFRDSVAGYTDCEEAKTKKVTKKPRKKGTKKSDSV